MSNTARILTGLLLVAALGAPRLEAQLTANAAINANATVVAPITVTAGTDLDFGQVSQGTSLTVDAQNANSGDFTVTGTNGAGIDLDWVLPTNLVSGGNNLQIDNFSVIRGDNATRATAITDNYAVGGAQSEVDFLGANNYNVFIGAQVTATGGQAVGLYTASIDLTVSYNGT